MSHLVTIPEYATMSTVAGGDTKGASFIIIASALLPDKLKENGENADNKDPKKERVEEE